MKTFEGAGKIETSREGSRAIVFTMYVVRAVSATLIMSLLLYILAAGVLRIFYPTPTFPEFVFGNLLSVMGVLVFLFLFQLAFYFYRLRRGRLPARSLGDILIGYLIPLLGIIAALYTAYAVGVM